ncbi:MAG: hypothetical protein R3202_11565, partial [Candidatus Competibacterales bacterium]|nr:hypothetical protein [Candidatus Competibacterales bacterium]
RTLWVFCACLMLGVTLIAASGGLLQQVRDSLQADSRALFGGDVEIEQRGPLSEDELAWLRANGTVSRLIELRTMLRAVDGRSQVVELQSVDDQYPLYGSLELAPSLPLEEVLAQQAGGWGVAVDPVLAQRLDLAVGDRVELGDLSAQVRALIQRQPDRSLRADWRGLPVLIHSEALAATGLVRPGSLLEYEYRVRIDDGRDIADWRSDLVQAFPDADWEVRTFAERSRRLGEVLGQVGSVLLLIGFSALFIGGLGVANSAQAYLQAKLATLAILRALGLRERRLARIYLGQLLLLAGLASLVGALLGGGLALAGTSLAAERLPLATDLGALAQPLGVALLFGLLTALTFSLPALGRALSVSPAALFRGIDGAFTATPSAWWVATGLAALLTLALVLVALPQPLFGLGFVAVALLLLVLLEGLVRLLGRIGRRLAEGPALAGRFQWRLALASLYRPGTPLRPTLLSLGSALTLLVASTLVVAALLRTINATLPERAPALVFYDIANFQRETLREVLGQASSLEQLDLAPLVLGRLSTVNGEALRDSPDPERAAEARDEHKLSYRLNNFDQVQIERGQWWPADYQGPPRVAMEDREADQLGLQVGDRLGFSILGRTVEAELVAIYGQKRFETRFWLEAIFSDGVLDPFISRYVGAAYLDHDEAVEVQTRLAAALPNVVTVRTAGILREARELLGRASAGLAVVAAVSLLASLLVLASVATTHRLRQVYDATVLHTLGARLAHIRTALRLEYALLALLTSAFAILLGSAIAYGLLEYRLELEAGGVWWTGAVTALLVSGLSLYAGARYLLRRLRLSPALLLRGQTS